MSIQNWKEEWAEILRILRRGPAHIVHQKAQLRTILEVMNSAASGDLSREAPEGDDPEIAQVARLVNQMVQNFRLVLESERQRKTQIHDHANQIIDVLYQMAGGDFSRPLPAGFPEEMGLLAGGVNKLTGDLKKLVSQIQESALRLGTSATQILSASKEQETASAEQAAAINQITATLDELTAASKQIALNADAVLELSENTLSSIQQGQQAVSETLGVTDRIREHNVASADRILKLSEKIQQIGKIVDLINGIAERSDLLALNAAVEGARAGEAGRGFSVVASEMRRLAESVAESTKEIKEIIAEVQKATNASVMGADEGIKLTEQGVHATNKTAEIFSQIVERVRATTSAVKQISLATQQQRVGTEQAVISMKEVGLASQQVLSASRQETAAAADLNSLAQGLKEVVTHFNLGEEPQVVRLGVVK